MSPEEKAAIRLCLGLPRGLGGTCLAAGRSEELLHRTGPQ